jgi:hypothetical protein
LEVIPDVEKDDVVLATTGVCWLAAAQYVLKTATAELWSCESQVSAAPKTASDASTELAKLRHMQLATAVAGFVGHERAEKAGVAWIIALAAQGERLR